MASMTGYIVSKELPGLFNNEQSDVGQNIDMKNAARAGAAAVMISALLVVTPSNAIVLVLLFWRPISVCLRP
jgi:hypothetical protein